MEKIDKKDKRILYELDKNSRRSFSNIGRKIGMKKNIVNYRINQLINKGIIKNFATVIDANKLGYYAIRSHIFYKNVSSDIEEAIINYFMNHPNIAWIGCCKGIFDLSFTLWTTDPYEFHHIWKNIQEKFSINFDKQSFHFYIKEIHYPLSFLLDNDYEISDRQKPRITGDNKKIDFDKTDIEILKLLSSNARISLSQMSLKINLTSEAINYRIKQLIKNGIITGFSVIINPFKIGYQIFKAYIYLDNYNNINKIINFIESNPNLITIDISTAEFQIELEFYYQDITQFYKTMKELLSKFPNEIKNYADAANIYMPTLKWFPLSE